MGPIVGGHTYQVASNTTHYKNLINARSKCMTIATKVQDIIDSLSSASGTEIDKVRVDLANVKNAFNSIKNSINERLEEIETRALNYDSLYDSFKDKCNRHEKITTSSYTSDSSGSSVLFFVTKSDKKHTINYYYDDLYWQEDGYFALKVKIVEKIEERTSKNALDSTMVDNGEQDTKTTYRFYKVPYDGKINMNNYLTTISSLNN